MNTLRGASSTMLPGLSLGLYRMMFGLLFLDMALQKAHWVIRDGHRFGWLYGWIWQEINHPTFGFYKTMLQAVVLPKFIFFGHLSFLTEIALGLSLLLGLFTVLGGIGGAAWMFNIALGSYSVPGEWYWIWPLLIVPQLVFAHTRAGRVLGMDQILWKRLGRDDTAPRGLRQLALRFA